VRDHETDQGCAEHEGTPPFGEAWESACEAGLACPLWHRDHHDDEEG
jgi:hypothetical protein